MTPISYASAATTQWLKLTPEIPQRINSRLTHYATTGHGDVKRLKGRSGMRLRVGDWRVIFYEQDNTIIMVAVGHRREIYN